MFGTLKTRIKTFKLGLNKNLLIIISYDLCIEYGTLDMRARHRLVRLFVFIKNCNDFFENRTAHQVSQAL